MISLNEAITHCLEVADGQTEQGKCPECAMEHRQLAEWLKELKDYRERMSCDDEGITPKSLATAFQFGMAFGFVKKYDEMDEVMEEFKKAITPQREACGDCISRQAVLDAIHRVGMCKCSTDEIQVADECLRAVETLPPVNPQRTGHWFQTNEFFINQDGQFVYKFICSECNCISYFRKCDKKAIGANVCPNCGAKMEEVQDDD